MKAKIHKSEEALKVFIIILIAQTIYTFYCSIGPSLTVMTKNGQKTTLM